MDAAGFRSRLGALAVTVTAAAVGMAFAPVVAGAATPRLSDGTFHIDELIPWIDHNLRTRADRQWRAIAGLSRCSVPVPPRS